MGVAEHMGEREAVPRMVADVVTISWVVADGPLSCDCGHEHYGRVPRVEPTDNFAAPIAARYSAQWGFCEDANCPCKALRHTVVRTAAEAGDPR